MCGLVCVCLHVLLLRALYALYACFCVIVWLCLSLSNLNLFICVCLCMHLLVCLCVMIAVFVCLYLISCDVGYLSRGVPCPIQANRPVSGCETIRDRSHRV